jgi:hypothetical protein
MSAVPEPCATNEHFGAWHLVVTLALGMLGAVIGGWKPQRET